MNRSLFALSTGLLALSLAAPGFAQQQSKAQQACLNKVVKSARKIPGAVLKDASGCIRKGATDDLPMGQTPDSCVVGDLKGKVAKAKTKVSAAATASCTTAPDFGFVDATTTADSYQYDNEVLIEDGFGSDLAATLVASDGVDPAGRCSATLPGLWRRVEDAMHRTVEACLKTGLKDGSIVDDAGFAACLDAIHTDAKGRVGKAVAQLEAKLPAKCPAGDLAGIFPGLVPICADYGASTDAAGLGDCSRDRLECRVCRIFNFAYGLDRDCDVFDDGNGANASCPDCGNAVIDSGEQCDDGNEVSGDGCDAQCRDEFCGDGSVNDNGAEQCDDGSGNSDTTPDACRLDCTNPVCGDGVTDSGEECDDGNGIDTDGCTNACTQCGNGGVAGAEQCDDGNNANGDCCSAACTFESMGSSCTGAPDGDCTDPGCNGAGSCVELPSANGTPCTDDDECSNASACTSGTCQATSYVVTGAACRWAIVGTPLAGAATDHRVYVENLAEVTGDLCGDYGRVEANTVIAGDLVATGGNSGLTGIEIEGTCDISGGDVVTDNALATGLAGSVMPGLVATTSVAAGQVLAKTPAGEYDTTGSDPRVGDCEDAQLAISTSTATLLDALTADADLAGTLQGLANGSTHTVNPVDVGGLNVFDVNNITGNQNVTLNISGGGSANTVVILRVQNDLTTNIGWTINLTNGLTAANFLVYGKGSGAGKCQIGQDNVGAGTLFCPNSRIKLTLRTQWTGALYGGGDSSGYAEAIDVGENVVFTFQRFTGF